MQISFKRLALGEKKAKFELYPNRVRFLTAELHPGTPSFGPMSRVFSAGGPPQLSARVAAKE